MANRRAYGSADQPANLAAHTCPNQRTKWPAITKPYFRSDRCAHRTANGCADRGTHRTAIGNTDGSAKQDPNGVAVVVAQREPDIRPFLPAGDRSAVHACRWLLQAV